MAERREPGHEPQPLHRLERLGERAAGRARRRASASTRTTTTGPARGSRTAPACSPGRASRSASPTPTARWSTSTRPPHSSPTSPSRTSPTRSTLLLDNATGAKGYYAVSPRTCTPIPTSHARARTRSSRPRQARGIPTVSAQADAHLARRPRRVVVHRPVDERRAAELRDQPRRRRPRAAGDAPAQRPDRQPARPCPQRRDRPLRRAEHQGHRLRDVRRGRRLVRGDLPGARRHAAGHHAVPPPGAARRARRRRSRRWRSSSARRWRRPSRA